MQFEMTLDRFHRFFTVAVLMLVPAILLVAYLSTGGSLDQVSLPELFLSTPALLGLLGAIFAVTFAWSPCGIEVIGGRIRILRRAWPALEIPRESLESVTLGGEGRRGIGIRVMGSGGLFGSYGWFSGKELGLYRLYATRFGRMVIFRRRSGRPVAVIVDDPEALHAALQSF